MELEGFGASLIGRAIFVYANAEQAWIPWEFVSGTQYSCRILLTSENTTLRCIEMENAWTFIIRPQSAKDWSCIATIIRGMGGTVLLTFDSGCPRAPDSFMTFLDNLVQDPRIMLTRIWVGTTIEIPVVPDAIFFPTRLNDMCTKIYDIIRCLPARNDHDAWKPISLPEWNTLVDTTTASHLGVLVSDIGEKEWKLFWHKIEDSTPVSKTVLFQKGLDWLRTAMAIIEKNRDIQ